MTSFLATYLLYAVALGAILAWLLAPRAHKVTFALAAILSAAVVGVLVKVLGALWTDPRPFVVDHTMPAITHNADNGFPSDHTALAAAIAFTVLVRNKVIGAVLVLITVALAVARVAAQVHHVPDVVAGAGAGAAAAGVGGWLAARLGSVVDRRWPALSGAEPVA